MQKLALAGLTIVGLLALVFSQLAVFPSLPAVEAAVSADAVGNATAVSSRKAAQVVVAIPEYAWMAEIPPPLPAEEKAVRVGMIHRDYEDVRLELLHGYGREGETFPGGSDALLRQFALLELEKHVDLARILTPQELEDIEFRDTGAGRLVQRLLGGSLATDEQRRAVFRLQRRFDLDWGYPSEATPASFAERDRARRTMDEQIHAVLGDALFGTWLGRADGLSPSEGGG